MSIGAQILAHCAPETSGEEPLPQLLIIVVFDATAANPIVAYDFVRRIANVEYIAATIARRIVAIHWIVIKHRQYPKTLRHYLPDRTKSTRPF